MAASPFLLKSPPDGKHSRAGEYAALRRPLRSRRIRLSPAGLSTTSSLVVLLGLVALTACGSSPLWPGNWNRDRRDREASVTPSNRVGDLGRPVLRRTDPTVTVGVMFEVARVEIRAAETRDAGKLWNHVDESRLEPSLAVRLARNGLRMGVGTPASWPAIRAVLESVSATVRKDDLAPQRGMPLAVGIDKVSPGETVFAYGRDDRLAGRTFDGGEKVLNADYFLLADGGGAMDMGVLLEVRHDRGTMTWEKREAVIEEIPEVDRHLFADVAARVSLAKDEFLLVGAAAETSNRYLLGPRFFTTERNGQAYDVLLFLTPRVLRSDTASRVGP